MRLLLSIGLAILLGLQFASCEHKPDLDNYRFILGDWEIRDDDRHRASYESWKIVSDTLFEGRSFDVIEGDTIQKEHLWLESRGGKAIYSAIVFGHNDNQRIYFENTLKTLDKARFENAQHNFPTLIQYKKSGGHFLEVLVCDEDDTLPRVKMHKIEG